MHSSNYQPDRKLCIENVLEGGHFLAFHVHSFGRAKTCICAKPGTLCSLCWGSRRVRCVRNSAAVKERTSLTGGFTNHAVSHFDSSHRLLTNVSTSCPAFCTNCASSKVALSDLIILSIVTPHSSNAPRYDGKTDGEGGGEDEPVKPQRPSWFTRADIEGCTREGWKMGRRVHIRVCSTSGGTAHCQLAKMYLTGWAAYQNKANHFELC